MGRLIMAFDYCLVAQWNFMPSPMLIGLGAHSLGGPQQVFAPTLAGTAFLGVLRNSRRLLVLVQRPNIEPLPLLLQN